MLRLFHRWLAALAGLLAGLLCSSAATPAYARPPQPVSSYFLDVAAPGEPPLALYAQEQGQGPVIVLLHGLGGSTYSWRYTAPALAQTHRVIALDLKGFGRSDKVFDTAYSALDQARLVSRFIHRRHLAHVTLIGHSFGGQVALMVTLAANRAHSASIDGLVLIDTPALPQRLTPVVALMRQPILPYALLTALPAEVLTAIAMGASVRHDLTRPYTDADATAYAEPLHDAAARHAYIQTARQIVPRNPDALTAQYRTVQQRTLLVWCREDEVVPVSIGRALVHLLPNANLTTIGGCNHSPPDESPRALATALHRFLDHPSSPPSN